MLIYPAPRPTFHSPQERNHGQVKERKAASGREKDLQDAKEAYLTQQEPSIRHAALTYHVPYGTLRDRVQGAKPRNKAHQQEQEKAIVRFCEALDDLGHPLRSSLVKDFAISLLPPSRRRELGKHCSLASSAGIPL